MMKAIAQAWAKHMHGQGQILHKQAKDRDFLILQNKDFQLKEKICGNFIMKTLIKPEIGVLIAVVRYGISSHDECRRNING